MTNKEEKIISWLLERPGYFKKSAIDTFNFYPWTETSKWNLSIKNFEKVFYEARRRYKASLTVKPVKIPPIKKVQMPKFGAVFKEKSRKYEEEGLWVILGCVHVPYHNKAFYYSFLKFLKDNSQKITGLIIAGDFVDMEALSSHDKGNISHSTLDHEYREANHVLTEIESLLHPDVQKVYIWGNHEDRYNRYMRQVDNSKLGAALQSPSVALNLVARGYHVFEDWKKSYVTIGKYLDVLHGEFTNVHTAKKHLDTYRKSCLYFHTHRKQVYIEGKMGAFNCGSMGDFKKNVFNYASRAMVDSWTNSFAVVNVDKEGFYHVDIPTWINNRFYFGNKVYSHGN